MSVEGDPVGSRINPAIARVDGKYMISSLFKPSATKCKSHAIADTPDSQILLTPGRARLNDVSREFSILRMQFLSNSYLQRILCAFLTGTAG